jgi:uncharacterized protein (TIGR03435 family)
MQFAFDVPEERIAHGPDWMGADKWDIEAKPDTPGMPSPEQLRDMVQKLLADRFALKFHNEKREMAAYVLTVRNDGPKMKKSADASVLGGFAMGPAGVLRVRGATMGEFADTLQRDILDRPVVDQTDLTGRWDFELQWTPDETQFHGRLKMPPQNDNADAAPPLFTAIQEQLGLKLEAQKADVPVIVIDHVDHPTPN